ncbi:MAG: hypothetical protein KER_03105 [Kerstersia gyiorum]|uniref:hypothetical protein n=1 Tax=Kerstersia gyiorum TaxID=206506 RepID=UPI0030CF3D90
MSTNWRIYLAAGLGGVLLALAAGAALQMYGKAQYAAGERAERHRQDVAELEAFRAEVGRLAGISVDLQGRIDVLQAERPKIIERYTTHVRESAPLPAGCIIDPIRLQHINAAIGAANATRQPGTTVPASALVGE